MRTISVPVFLFVPIISFAQFNDMSDHVQWNIKELDTGRNVEYMTDREKDMLREINMVRAFPQRYITFIEQHIEQQKEEAAHSSGGVSYTTTTTTVNGKKSVKVDTIKGEDILKEELKAANELIEQLKEMKPAPILKPSKCIYIAASKHGIDCVKMRKLQHEGSNGSDPWDRIGKECTGMSGNENLAGGPKTVRQIVINLLVDSGIPGRGHRHNMLNKNWNYGACYEAGKVGIYTFSWVQNFGN